MKIILTEDVMGLGDIGETVNVKPGYARNFLIPRGVAVETGAANAKAMEHRVRQIESKKRRLKAGAEDEAKRISAAPVQLELRVGSGGKVFGSVSARDIAERLTQQGFEIDRRRVLLNEPIRKIGTHVVKVKLHPEVFGEISVTVNATAATKEEEKAETESARKAMEAAKEEREEAEEGAEDEGDDEEEEQLDD